MKRIAKDQKVYRYNTEKYVRRTVRDIIQAWESGSCSMTGIVTIDKRLWVVTNIAPNTWTT